MPVRNVSLEELRKMSKDELQEKLRQLRREYFELRSKLSAGAPPEQIHRFKMVRREIARVLTVMRERGYIA
uniref:Large ribosomal subunit protein uL29 n=1 Tax=uncultured korarchaeote TaxID=161241 RepID=A0A1L2JK41_9CREN|nr:ribosomal protein L29 [uncultured korarchaeote]